MGHDDGGGGEQNNENLREMGLEVGCERCDMATTNQSTDKRLLWDSSNGLQQCKNKEGE